MQSALYQTERLATRIIAEAITLGKVLSESRPVVVAKYVALFVEEVCQQQDVVYCNNGAYILRPSSWCGMADP